MVKYRLYGEEEADETVTLRLVRGAGISKDSIKLVAVDEYGDIVDQGNILRLTKKGTVIMNSSVSKKIGLSLDTNRKVKVE